MNSQTRLHSARYGINQVKALEPLNLCKGDRLQKWQNFSRNRMRFICDAKICVAPARNNRPCNCSGTFRSSRAKKISPLQKTSFNKSCRVRAPQKKMPGCKKLLSEAKNVLDAKLMVGSLKSLKPVNCNSESFCCWCSRAKKLKNGFRDNRLEMFFSNKFGFEHFFSPQRRLSSQRTSSYHITASRATLVRKSSVRILHLD